jgi:Mrp family chromosome partitioning ATPase
LDPRPASLKELMDAIEVTSESETGFVTIAARSLRASRAAEIANAFAAALVAARSEQARAQIQATITGVEEQLSGLSGEDTTGRRALSEELQRLRALEAAQNNNAVLVQPALVPDLPVSPKPLRNAALALVLAVMIGVGLAFLIDHLDRRVRQPEELRDLADLPVLGFVPEASFRAKSDSPLHESDAIQSLRASLSYLRPDQPLQSVIISSPGAGEGKTTIAASLAISLARSGRDVILIDGDLRRSEVSERLALDPHAPSLGSVLASGSILVTSLTAVKIDAGRLRVLPAGSPPPNPSELMLRPQAQAEVQEAGSDPCLQRPC